MKSAIVRPSSVILSLILEITSLIALSGVNGLTVRYMNERRERIAHELDDLTTSARCNGCFPPPERAGSETE